MHLEFFAKRFKIKKVILFLVFKVIIVENLKIMHLRFFVMTLALSINFHLLEGKSKFLWTLELLMPYNLPTTIECEYTQFAENMTVKK